MVEVIPGILEHSFSAIVAKIRQVEQFCRWVQIDLLDGTLFNASCFHDPSQFSTLRTPINLELHMMVVNPIQLIDQWANVGFKRFIAHIEGISDTENFLVKVRSKKREVGLAVDIDTDISILEPYLPNLDVVLIMGVHTGQSGQIFDHRALVKIHKVRQLVPDLPIEVDGGINPETAKTIIHSGATRLVSTSYIFNSPHIYQAIKTLGQIS